MHVAVYGSGNGFADTLEAASSDYLSIVKTDDFEGAREQCLEGDLDGVLVIPDDAMGADTLSFYTREGSNIVMTETVRNTIGGVMTSLKAAEAGLTPQQVDQITTVPLFNIIQINRDGGDKAGQNFEDFIYTAIAFIMLLYMTTLLYSQMIGRSVVTEKTSKTVEVMLSSVKPSS